VLLGSYILHSDPKQYIAIKLLPLPPQPHSSSIPITYFYLSYFYPHLQSPPPPLPPHPISSIPPPPPTNQTSKYIITSVSSLSIHDLYRPASSQKTIRVMWGPCAVPYSLLDRLEYFCSFTHGRWCWSPKKPSPGSSTGGITPCYHVKSFHPAVSAPIARQMDEQHSIQMLVQNHNITKT
jgi:hypothetical protein